MVICLLQHCFASITLHQDAHPAVVPPLSIKQSPYAVNGASECGCRSQMTYTKVHFLSVMAMGRGVLKQATEWVAGQYGVRRPLFRTKSLIYCCHHRRASCKLYIRCVQISPSKKMTVFVFAYYVWLYSSVTVFYATFGIPHLATIHHFRT